MTIELLDCAWTNIMSCHDGTYSTPLKPHKEIVESFLLDVEPFLRNHQIAYLNSTCELFTLLIRQYIYLTVPYESSSSISTGMTGISCSPYIFVNLLPPLPYILLIICVYIRWTGDERVFQKLSLANAVISVEMMLDMSKMACWYAWDLETTSDAQLSKTLLDCSSTNLCINYFIFATHSFQSLASYVQSISKPWSAQKMVVIWPVFYYILDLYIPDLVSYILLRRNVPCSVINSTKHQQGTDKPQDRGTNQTEWDCNVHCSLQSPRAWGTKSSHGINFDR
jgi:hypothetical protein